MEQRKLQPLKLSISITAGKTSDSDVLLSFCISLRKTIISPKYGHHQNIHISPIYEIVLPQAALQYEVQFLVSAKSSFVILGDMEKNPGKINMMKTISQH